jgi:hypothetical protein
VFHHIVWRAITGDAIPHPGSRRLSVLEARCRFRTPPNDYLVSTATTITEGAMKYLCLIYFEEQKLNALSTRELDALIDEALAYDEVLRKSGHFMVTQALQSVQAATTLRPQKGKMSITDGPFAETKEQLGGFILIDAKDLNEAIQVASKIPPARLGCIEVRPIKELTP